MKVKPKGIGDLAERVFIKMGVKTVVKKLVGEDCKCDERRDKLNQMFPLK